MTSPSLSERALTTHFPWTVGGANSDIFFAKKVPKRWKYKRLEKGGKKKKNFPCLERFFNRFKAFGINHKRNLCNIRLCDAKT